MIYSPMSFNNAFGPHDAQCQLCRDILYQELLFEDQIRVVRNLVREQIKRNFEYLASLGVLT